MGVFNQKQFSNDGCWVISQYRLSYLARLSNYGTVEKMIDESDIQILIGQAKEGSPAALEALVKLVQDQIYNLALRMLWHPADAQDATQEILIKVITHLSEFRQESRFTTWVYRIATNYLLTSRKRRAELKELTFENLDRQLETGLAMSGTDRVEERVLVEEVRLACSLGMLLCFDREHRIAYILAEIIGVKSEEGAYLMEITPEAFRKRVSRARLRLRNFVGNNCGIVNPLKACRCEKQAAAEIKLGTLKPNRLRFANAPTLPRPDAIAAAEQIEELKKLDRMVALFRSHPDFAAPKFLSKRLKIC